ncbi:secreted RxLR effector protein 161-like [Arachis duranensis]|uniref:Secreted RxLR effector protein 161-like n=1 Tax=Arachis duranensis TaxID=130453 RepID=A0A9C6TTR1_ARADU|nr:secreted RxLR effector protein 161-like [Arachis duranensis]
MGGTVLDNPTLHRQLVGGLVCLTVTCPDIAYPVHVLSQFLSAPRTTHYAAAYSDADWAGDPIDRHSTIDYCLFLGDSLIFWRAKKQTFTARSSTKGEYRDLANMTAEVVSIRWLLEDLGAPQSSLTDIFCDNRSAIQIAHNDVFMNAPNTLRLIVTLFGNIYLLMLFIS